MRRARGSTANKESASQRKKNNPLDHYFKNTQGELNVAKVDKQLRETARFVSLTPIAGRRLYALKNLIINYSKEKKVDCSSRIALIDGLLKKVKE
ncbi:MAG: hypothetical protein V1911_00640 [Candidatus Micrarchaeota archaeon]